MNNVETYKADGAILISDEEMEKLLATKPLMPKSDTFSTTTPTKPRGQSLN